MLPGQEKKNAELIKTRSFIPLVIALAITIVGNEIQTAAFVWWTLAYTNSPSQTAGVTLASVLPRFLFTPIAGAIADRYDRRSILLVSEGINILLIGSVEILIHLDLFSPKLVTIQV